MIFVMIMKTKTTKGYDIDSDLMTLLSTCPCKTLTDTGTAPWETGQSHKLRLLYLVWIFNHMY